LQNFTDYTAMSVKHLNLASKSPHVDKQLSLKEIRVGQYLTRWKKD